MTQAHPDLTDLSPLQLGIDGARPLTELTDLMSSICDAAEDATACPAVVLRIQASAPGPAPSVAVGVNDVNRWERALRRLERLRVVTVAVASGRCTGLGLDVLLTTDHRIASPDFRLLVRRSDGQAWPGMALYRLVQQVGLARTRQLVLLGRELDAEQALALGLIDDVQVDAAAAVRDLSAIPGRASGAELAIRRQLIFEAQTASFEDALGTHLAACDRELRRLQASDPEAGPPPRRFDR